MIKINSNRSLPILSLLIMTTAGCTSHTANDSLSQSVKPPVISHDDYYAKPTVRPKYPNRKLAKLNFKKSSAGYVKGKGGSIWDRLVSLYALPEVENERIEKEINWFIKNPEYLVRVQQRAEPYLHLILEEIESKNIPGELALLPIVESAFRPNANSSAQASGLWQFIPETGRLYGLKQNSWYDGRRDVYASTQAATQFLKDLGENFDGDWLLALASYNWGKGNVQKSIDRNMANDLPTDYWSLRMPNETFNYVPRLIAVAKIFANPELYNIPLQNIPDEPYFEVVNVDSPLDLRKAAELANTSMEEIVKLNPAFKKNRTTSNGPNRLLIPVNQAELFRQNLAQLSVNDRVSSYDEREQDEPVAAKTIKTQIPASTKKAEKHVVKRGETLSVIANKHGITVSALLKANGLTNASHIQTGKTLSLPGSANINHKEASSQKPITAQTAKQVAHTVTKGQTFWRITQEYSVSADDLAKWNNLKPGSPIKAGQKLVIKNPGKSEANKTTAPTQLVTKQSAAKPSSSKVKTLANAKSVLKPVNKQVQYKIKPGDSLSQISKKFNVPVSDLVKWNPSNAKNLKAGNELKVVLGNT
ncbi:LysM peptidoglycan-binding domain-containing protein [Methylicorpusculum sp.]|uniref:LysM peptidoglycan-binding domain-containing protein n=1 Tax=Methylicorpusculum sp. TaxID=2713644 RepID=UPI00272F4E75|nr:LysM peptidoglycan-binding domain-containing protein [Methylicorpusculum sp.]MDP2178400.1 LysM peptidoglycan-binding domain-containing protein [Methylicorpusculum sp.]MDP3530765.1 LysM peptidoglycan-binding domain-containing protein [Methylicorpusculum sp.]